MFSNNEFAKNKFRVVMQHLQAVAQVVMSLLCWRSCKSPRTFAALFFSRNQAKASVCSYALPMPNSVSCNHVYRRKLRIDTSTTKCMIMTAILIAQRALPGVAAVIRDITYASAL